MNRKNLANSTLSAGINTSVTSISVASGTGVNFPATPFYATITPVGVLSTLANSEIVQVTGVSTDTLTVVRARRGTTAQSFSTGAVISNGVYAEDITPAGAIEAYAGITAPEGWLLCAGQAVSRTTYSVLWAALSKSSTVTMTIAAPGVVTWTGHGLRTGDQVSFTTTGALPTGVTANTVYYANVIDANTFLLATTQDNSYLGTYITTSGTQSGTHTATYAPYGIGDGSTTFNVPDLNGRVVAGKDDMNGTAANRLNKNLGNGMRGYNLGNTGGDQAHQHSSGTYKANMEIFTTGGTFYIDYQSVQSYVYQANIRRRVSGGAADEGNAEYQDVGVKIGGVSDYDITIQPTIIANYIIRV